jgi:hypothetical protein
MTVFYGFSSFIIFIIISGNFVFKENEAREQRGGKKNFSFTSKRQFYSFALMSSLMVRDHKEMRNNHKDLIIQQNDDEEK